MVTALIFLLLLIATITAWYGHRTNAIIIFIVSFAAAIAWFLNHITSTLGLVL